MSIVDENGRPFKPTMRSMLSAEIIERCEKMLVDEICAKRKFEHFINRAIVDQYGNPIREVETIKFRRNLPFGISGKP